MVPTWTNVTLANGVNMNSFILAYLQEWMEYEVKILAYNDVGDSSFSAVVLERTRESGMFNILAAVWISPHVKAHLIGHQLPL
ncbi:hypothetical protein DPMN_029856 [Dreissena polymorpha]|nr:hypothetical protein DPMN_183803 [Dreissena polymorpha]KAH3866757.1 hypothetical protein DPMN_029856 [Dreissena polymorpha]